MKGLLIMLLLLSGTAQACDICGCGAGSYYVGLLPEFNSKIAGVRYRYNSLTTHIGPGGSTSYLSTKEVYQTAEFWAGWTFKERFRLMASIPLSHNSKTNAEEQASKSGLGDATIQGMYRLLSKRNNAGSDRLLVQDLWIGTGLKLPTGKYQPADKESQGKSANLFQLGTGSFDILFTAMYDIRLQDAGLNINASYKVNTTNGYAYDYGNKFSGSGQLYYKFRFKEQLSIAPNLGFSYDRSAKDLDYGYRVFPSGGYIFSATMGAELMYRQLSFGGNFQPVCKQRLAEGIVQANNRFMLHTSVRF